MLLPFVPADLGAAVATGLMGMAGVVDLVAEVVLQEVAGLFGRQAVDLSAVLVDVVDAHRRGFWKSRRYLVQLLRRGSPVRTQTQVELGQRADVA